MSNIYYQRPNNSGKNTDRNTQKVSSQPNNSYYQPNYQAPRYDNYNRPVIKAQSATKDLIANVVLVILSILFVIAFITFVGEISDSSRYYEQKASSFWWEYDNGRYVYSIRNRYENMYNGVEETEELSQCYAVSEYFEATSLYKAAVCTGKEESAMKYLEKMAKAYSEMGDVSYLAEDIDTKLGISDIVK